LFKEDSKRESEELKSSQWERKLGLEMRADEMKKERKFRGENFAI